MYRKNVAGQHVWGQVNSTLSGQGVTTSVSINVAYAGTMSEGAGTLSHLGGGLWDYEFDQGETNHDQFAYQFTHENGIPIGGTIVPTAADPTDAASFGIGRIDTTLSTILASITSSGTSATTTEIAAAVWADAKAALLDTTVSTRAPASTALSSATWTDARAALLDAMNAILSSATFGNSALYDEINGITLDIGTIVPTTDAPDAESVDVGTEISGTYVQVQTLDANYHILAPVNPGGLDMTYTYEIGTPVSRAPVSLSIDGYWNGSGQYCNVFAYDAILGIWDQLSNSSTRMNSRNSNASYVYQLNREHIDPDTGYVLIRFVSPSTNTAHRLNLDRVLVGTVDVSTAIVAGISAADVWSFPSRELTSTAGESLNTDAIAAAVRDVSNSSPATGSLGAGVADKTGYKLASDGLNAVAAPADLANDTAARASFVGMIRALFNRFYNKVTQDATEQIVHNDDGDEVSTMNVADDGTTQTKDKSA